MRRATRIRRQTDFAYIRQSGRNRAGRYCAVQIAAARQPGRRVAIVVSRYFSRKAVERNRARRLVREACRQILPEFGEAWLVLRPRQPIKHAKSPAVAKDLRRTLQALNGSPGWRLE